jgi:hypothetical protein
MTTNSKIVLVTMAGVCLALTSARALPINLSTTSSDVLGIVYPAQPSGAAADVSYINGLIGLTLGGETTISGNLVWRSDNAFSSLPKATTVGDASGTAASLLDTGFTYLAANYGSGSDGGMIIWDIASITGGSTIDLSLTADDLGLSGWVLFDPSSSSNQSVPDGGPTALLLGIGLLGGGLARRYLSPKRA